MLLPLVGKSGGLTMEYQVIYISYMASQDLAETWILFMPCKFHAAFSGPSFWGLINPEWSLCNQVWDLN